MTTTEKIVRKHLSKADRAYRRHLADKHDLNGPYLIGKVAALHDLAKELGLIGVERKAKKTGR